MSVSSLLVRAETPPYSPQFVRQFVRRLFMLCGSSNEWRTPSTTRAVLRGPRVLRKLRVNSNTPAPTIKPVVSRPGAVDELPPRPEIAQDATTQTFDIREPWP